jgi:hypothetical protein
MAERRRPRDLSQRWLIAGEAAQYFGHSTSQPAPGCLPGAQKADYLSVDLFVECIGRHVFGDWSEQRSRRPRASRVPGDFDRTPPGGARFANAVPDAATADLRQQPPNRRGARPDTMSRAQLCWTLEPSIGDPSLNPRAQDRREIAA